MIKYFLSLALVLLMGMGFAQDVKWYSIEEAIALNNKEPRKLMIDVYTDWCGWCKQMDKNTFSNSIVATYLNTNYYPVKFNAEQKEDVNILNETFKYVPEGRGYHELAAALLNGQMSYPSVVFMNEQNQIFHVQKGYVEAPQFDRILRFIGDDAYKNSSYEDWNAQYKSPFDSK